MQDQNKTHLTRSKGKIKFKKYVIYGVGKLRHHSVSLLFGFRANNDFLKQGHPMIIAKCLQRNAPFHRAQNS